MLKKTVIAVALLATAHAHATLVVDTGVPNALVLDGNHWLAGQMTFSQALTINSISAWLNDQGNIASGFAGDKFTVALYNNSGNVPGSLVSRARGHFTTASGNSGWNGAFNLNWSVGPGIYWAAFEIGCSDTFAGIAQTNAPNPLAHYAFNDGSGYQAFSGSALGVQVGGTVAAVPEPESYALMLGGLGMLGFIARRKKQAA